MVYEVEDWKAPGCSLMLEIDKLSDREIFSAEIGEGLNVDHRTMRVGLIIANILGMAGLKYEEHFVFKIAILDQIIFDFCDKATRDKAEIIIQEYQAKNATDSCPDCGSQLAHQESIVLCHDCGYQSIP